MKGIKNRRGLTQVKAIDVLCIIKKYWWQQGNPC